MDEEPLVAIGKLGKTRGIRGEIYCLPLTDFVERFDDLDAVTLEFPDRKRLTARIEGARFYGNRFAVKFRGLNTPRAVEIYRGATVLIPKSETFELPEDTFYVFEIVGMSVETADGESVGTVKEVLSIPGNDVYVVDRDGEEILLPATRELLRIDRDGRRIVVEKLEGLLGN